jgi:hypothetical protein
LKDGKKFWDEEHCFYHATQNLSSFFLFFFFEKRKIIKIWIKSGDGGIYMNDWWKTCSRLIYESRNSCKSQKFRKWLRARDWHGLQKDKLEFGKYLWCIVLLPTHLNLPERFRSVFGFFWIKKPNFLKLFSPKNIYIKIHYIYIYPFLIPKHKQIRLKKKSNQRTLSSFDLYFFLKIKISNHLHETPLFKVASW